MKIKSKRRSLRTYTMANLLLQFKILNLFNHNSSSYRMMELIVITKFSLSSDSKFVILTNIKRRKGS